VKARRLIGFLRAINVGGHTVTMATLRALLMEMGLADVETFIASGNVIFRTAARDLRALERKIGAGLARGLGFEADVFLRTGPEVAAIAALRPFPAARVRTARTRCVGFLAEPLTGAATRRVRQFRTATDEFHVEGREVYWLSRLGQSQSKFTNAAFERALGVRSTFRSLTTVERLVARYGLTTQDA